MDIGVLSSTECRFDLIKTKESHLVDKVNDALYWGAIDYLRKNGFMWVEVPILTKITGACENVNTLYSVDHFGKEAFLAQTGQLYLEAKIPVYDKVWTVITSSRAESSADSRHLNQFQLIEFEHKGNLDMLLENIEGTIKAMMYNALQNRKDELGLIGRCEEVSSWVNSDFGRITYTDAINILKGTEYEIAWGEDLTSSQELMLVKEMGAKPLFITHYPKEIKFFNMKENEHNPSIVNSSDLIMPYSGESVGSAERENNHLKLVERLKESNMYKILEQRGKTLDDFKDYLDLIKKDPVLHSGCGIGFSRVSQSILGSKDIRASTSFPIQSNVLY